MRSLLKSNGRSCHCTHPDVERFFFSLKRASWCLRRAAPGHGEVMVLDMGRLQKIVDVARALIRMSGRSDVKTTSRAPPGREADRGPRRQCRDHHPDENPLVTSAQVIPLEEKLLPDRTVHDHASAMAWCRAHSVTVEPMP
jgi:hypothetical protein